MESDRELLELAAKAAGFTVNARAQAARDELMDPQKASLWIDGGCTAWNPLKDDGHALRLAVKLREKFGTSITAFFGIGRFLEWEADAYASARRAIVRAAAEIGKQMNADKAKG